MTSKKQLHDFITVDKSRFQDAVDAYFLWKELNSYVKTASNRGINFPETISETLTCYAYGLKLNRGTQGDATDNCLRIIEMKATSNIDRDVSSFSPSDFFDELYFIVLDQKNDIVQTYQTHINSDQLKKIKVNKNQTVSDQQRQGRRPRFSVLKEIIQKNDIKPTREINLRKATVKNI